MRYLERQGVERAVALTQGSIDGLTGFVVQALVLIVVVPLADVDLTSTTRLGRGHVDAAVDRARRAGGAASSGSWPWPSPGCGARSGRSCPRR